WTTFTPPAAGSSRRYRGRLSHRRSQRDETPLPTPKLEALRTFTLAMVRERGNVDDATLQAFYDAGFAQRHVLEVILGLAQKVMSNYTNHIANTPVDAPMQKFDWVPKADR
uniref:carboxymuconolactone decarboxylase family protein n=1 Tax=Roseovarius nanhaiticus TaxID=573024 RepID=UPI003CD0DA01